MTSIHLENGVRIGVFGDVSVTAGPEGVTVSLEGPIVKMEPSGVLKTLKGASAA